MQPARRLIGQVAGELARHAPFDSMPRVAREALAAALTLRYYPAGTTLAAPGGGLADRLFIIQQGAVEGRVENEGDRGSAVSLGEGECFPLGALISLRPVSLAYRAARDTFCYELPLEGFEHLMDTSRAFRDFATRRLATLLEQSRETVQRDFHARLTGGDGLMRPVADACRRSPVTVPPDATVREVLGTMQAERVGSVVVVAADGAPTGIFTERDVLDRVALPGIDQATPISAVMTPAPFALPSSAPLFEAAQAMARHRFRHVLVMDEGRLAGVVSERDLFTLQRLSLAEVAKTIEQAQDAAGLAAAAADIRRLAGALLAQGVAAEQVTQFVTTLNDALAARVLELAALRAPPPPVPWCWLALGSEGRMEQTLATDQDNALLFAGDGNEDALRPAFLAFADEANRLLDQAGFPLCRGDIMARNPRWCLSAAEWRRQFDAWLVSPQPGSLLHAAVFFDFRPLAGDAQLAASLRGWLRERAMGEALFLAHLAKNALTVRPPLGVVRDFVADDAAHPGMIDLKQLGARPFIDAARVYALQQGVTATNTALRLRQAAPRMRMQADEAAAIVEAFHFVQLLRLRSQEEGGIPNHLDPLQLNPLDRRILKESLRQARKLQDRLAMDFPA